MSREPDGTYKIVEYGQADHYTVLKRLYAGGYHEFVIEDLIPFGRIGKTSTITLKWIGRFTEAASSWTSALFELPRKTIVAHITGSSKGGDPQVRKALIERYGERTTAGITYDVWSALAIATTHLDTHATSNPNTTTQTPNRRKQNGTT